MARQNPRRSPVALVSSLALVLAGCGGGDSSDANPASAPSPTASIAAYAVPAQEALTVAEVQTIIAQAAGEAQARNLPSVIAVTDRVGNVLGVFRMNGARATMQTSRLTGAGTLNATPVDAQGLELPAELGAIAKAITGAYLSSSGNAFSTRTASQIVQQHFPPAPSTPGLESGPLFGVQFSQLPCSDLTTRFTASGSTYLDAVSGAEVATAARIGPNRSPLGLAADPGGFPIYKNGVVVGGIGVMGDGDYGFDPNTLDVDSDAEEFIALAGIQGFAPADAIRADRITADGTSFRFSDAAASGLHPLQGNFAAINGSAGLLIPVPGYSAGIIVAGTAYGTETSGFRTATAGEFSASDAFVLTNGAGASRFPLRAGTDGAAVAQPLTREEVAAILEEAFKVSRRARAQIRKPLDSRAQVTISVVDTYGSALGLVRSPDAPVFGTDVALQKARTAAFFSSRNAAVQLQGNPDPEMARFVQNARTFLADPASLTGNYAYSARGHGLLSRPYFPDGEVGRPNGPFSRPIGIWNPFATGLQSALIVPNLVEHATFYQGAGPDTAHECTKVPAAPNGRRQLANGIQIFPGAVPIYRGSVLVGAIGVSGDGIDQDDMIAFLGAHNGGARGGGLGNAPKSARVDQIVVNVGSGVRLRYVNCPFAPFLDSSDQNVCEGL